MGAVGLSFGNPTSGTGFDVSTTVSEIMASYQAVETPWNTQLSTLSTEDAAFTTIGTALSNLSTAAFALTNFEGVLASMEGSSSNPDVLDLTAASTSAIAGSHEVTVTQLAQTDTWTTSGTPVSASATLSGSISIAVGSGTATTFTINSSDDTLATLASTINSSGIGVNAEVLSNSNGSYLSLVSGTSGTGGKLTISDSTSPLTATGTSGTTTLGFTNPVIGQDAEMVVDGSTVSSSSNTVTTAIPGVTFQLLDTSSTPVQVEIANDTADVTSAMNNFVSAYNAVMTDINTQEGDSAAGTTEPLFGNPVIAQLQQQLSAAMNLSQNSVWDSSAYAINPNDTLSGTINISVGSGTATPFTATNDTLADLATQINADTSLGVTASVLTNTTGSYLSLVSKTPGTAGDINVTGSLTDTLTNSAVDFSDTNVGSSINQFSALGISSVTNDNGSFSANSGGLLSIDSTTLNNVLNSDYQALVNFFQDAAGVGTSFGNLITSLGSASSTGLVTGALNQVSAQESTLNADITNENAIISSEQASLTTELEDANETLQAIPTQVNEVNELYAAITGYGETQS
jgi:flagellar hook-associated protein 2